MVICFAAIALATESTRNGMSSLTMPMRIRRCPASPPVDWMATSSSPGLRRAADLGEELGRFALGFSRQAMGLAGQGVARQRLANGLDQRLRQARMGSHELIGLRE